MTNPKTTEKQVAALPFSMEQKWESSHDLTTLLCEVFMCGAGNKPLPDWVTYSALSLCMKVAYGEILDWGEEFPKPNGKRNKQKVLNEALYKYQILGMYVALTTGRWGKQKDGKSYSAEKSRSEIEDALADPNNTSLNSKLCGCVKSVLKERGKLQTFSASTIRDWIAAEQKVRGKDWSKVFFSESAELQNAVAAFMRSGPMPRKQKTKSKVV